MIIFLSNKIQNRLKLEGNTELNQNTYEQKIC